MFYYFYWPAVSHKKLLEKKLTIKLRFFLREYEFLVEATTSKKYLMISPTGNTNLPHFKIILFTSDLEDFITIRSKSHSQH